MNRLHGRVHEHNGTATEACCVEPIPPTPADAYRAAAAAVAAARVRYAESFLLWKARGNATSDEKARQHAVIDTRDELTTLLAELEIAKEAYRQS